MTLPKSYAIYGEYIVVKSEAGYTIPFRDCGPTLYVRNPEETVASREFMSFTQLMKKIDEMEYRPLNLRAIELEDPSGWATGFFEV